MFKESAIANVFIVLLPFIIGLFVVFSFNVVMRHPIFLICTSWALYGFGFVLFLISKLSTIKSGHLFSFGSSQMTRKNQIFYRAGYSLMILAFVVTISLIITAGFQHKF